MFVDVSVRAVINCPLPLLHGSCIILYAILLTAYIVSHRLISPHEGNQSQTKREVNGQ